MKAHPHKSIIAHPGRQYSHQTALALQEGGMLGRYFTATWYKPDQFPYSLVDWLPQMASKTILHSLKKRSFPPIDLNLVEPFPLWKTLAILATSFSQRRTVSEWHTHQLSRKFDKWVLRKLWRMDCDLFIGYEVAALDSFRVCEQKSIPRILDLAAEHFTLQKRIFEEEEELGNPLIQIEPNLLKEIQEIKEQELSLANFVLTPSSYAKESLVKGGVDEQKIIQIPYGVDLSLFTPKERYKRDGRFIILYVGAITPRKGLKYLLEAFRKLSLPQSELILIGGMAGGENLLERYQGAYTYIPFLHHEELVRFYQEADLFVFPSLLDSFAMVVLEAMACGTPVIVSENTGAKDAVRNGIDGYIVPIRDVEALKQRIDYLYQHRETLEVMGGNARSQAEEYSWEVYRGRVRETVTKIWTEQGKRVYECLPA